MAGNVLFNDTLNTFGLQLYGVLDTKMMLGQLAVQSWYSGIGHNEGRKEGNVLFNDALNTFYLRLYGVRHMG